MREGCPNYEVVVFQPRTFHTSHLGSAAYCYYLIYPFCAPFFFSRFLDFSFSPLSYLLPIFSRSYFNTSEFSSPPHLISCCEAPITLMSPAARHQAASTASTCAQSRVPTLDAVTVLVRYPLWIPQLASRSLSTHRGLACLRPSAYLFYCLVLPEFSSESWHRPVFVSLSCAFSKKVKRPMCVHSLKVARPGPHHPLLDHSGAVHNTWLPPPLPGLLPSL